MTEGLKTLMIRLLDEKVTPMGNLGFTGRQLIPCLTCNRLARVRDGMVTLTTEGRDVAECYAGCRRVA